MPASLRSLCFAFFLCLTFTTSAKPEKSRLVVDGLLDDPVWRNLTAENLVPSEAGVPLEMGGELRATIVGRYLYLAASLPEPTGRVTARMIGRNPNWEDEDLLRVVAGADIGYTDREVKINPLGAYSVERNGQFVHPGADQYLIATHISEKEWTVELAFPLDRVAAPGSEPILLSVERVRAARPGSPQQRWHWPQYGPVAKVSVTSRDWDLSAPEFRPSLPGDNKNPLKAGRVKELPSMENGWQDLPWRDVPVWRLLRDEPAARLPRFHTEVKLLHDGRTLGILANCSEPGAVLVRPQVAGAGPGPQDILTVYLAISGSAYAQLAINPLGLRHDANGVTGGPLVSRVRDWSSGARSLVRETAEGWVVRMDIPLKKVAEMLGETKAPAEWRILLRRFRPGRDGEPLEISVLPVIQSDTPLCPARYQRLVLTDSEPSNLQVPTTAVLDEGSPPFETRVLSATQRREFDLAEMLDRQIRTRVHKIIEDDNQAWAQIGTRADWERYRDPRIKALAASFGDFPQRVPLEVRVTKEFLGSGYRRQDLVYLSRPGLWVPANLYLPAEPRVMMPGIIIVHSHHRPRTQAELQDMGILWARVGCAVLIMDQIGHGERIQNHPWNRDPYHSRYMMGMQLYLAGESLVKWMVWDIMRGVDLLLERKDIDPNQVILLGAVAGGGDPAAVTAALDPRIAAVAPFNFVRTGTDGGEWESTRCLRRSISDGFFAWVIDASVAPRRLVYAMEMGWENYKVHEAWERYQKVFAFYGVPHHLDEAHGFGTFPGPGECTNIGPSQRKTLYPELNRWFGIPIPPGEPDDRRPEAELASLTPAVAAELRMKTIHELASEVASAKLNAARAELQKLSLPARRNWLQTRWAKKLGDIEPNHRPEAIWRWKQPWKNAEVEGITIETEPGITVPFLLLRPKRSEETPLAVVVAISQGGKERILGNRSREVESLLNGGVVVCLPDLRGTGETSPDPRRGLVSEEDSRAATEFMLGNTLLGARLKDLRTVLVYLSNRDDLDSKRIALWGDSYAPVNPSRLLLDEVPGWQIGPVIQQQAEPLGGLVALLGGLYEDSVRAVALHHGLAGYLNALDDNFTYIPNDIIVPGALEVGDISDLAAVFSPRPLLLEGLVDGRNRLVFETELRRQYARAFESYQSSPQNLVIRSKEVAPSVVDWLLAQFRSAE